MPQTESMSAEELLKLFKKFINSELPDDTIMMAAMVATEYPKNYENAKREAYGFIEGYKAGYAQLIASTLQAAADRARKCKCPFNDPCWDDGIEEAIDAILAPLDKTDKGE